MEAPSNLTFTWKRPIVFDAALASAIQDTFRSFANRSRIDLVLGEGRNPAEITDAAAALAIFNAQSAIERDYELKSLADSLDRIERCSWSVILADGTKIQSISIDQLLKLPNAGLSKIKTAAFENGSYSNSMSISMRNGDFTSEISISAKGTFDTIRASRSEIERVLEAYGRPWWMFRHPALWIVFAGFAVIWDVVSIVMNLRQPQNIPYTQPLFLGVAVPVLFIFFTIGTALVTAVVRAWNWVFPMTEFRFGGGILSGRTRASVRWGLWAIPLLSLILPFLVNKLSQ